jgi:hypothetical protein
MMPVMACKVPALFFALALAAVMSGAPCRSQTIDLPSGWTVASGKSGITEIHIAGSDDVVIAGIVSAGDAVTVASAIAAQTTAAFKIDAPFPLKRGADGMVQTGGTLLFADGRPGVKYVAAAPLRAGGTALVAIVTADRANQAAFTDKVAELGDMLRSLQAGRTVPAPVTAVTPPPKLQPLAAGPAKAAPGMAGLTGLWKAGWMETRYGMAGMELVAESANLVFAADGSFAIDIPVGSFDATAIRAIARANPDRGGRATVSGSKITLQYASGKTGTATIERSRSRIDGLHHDGRLLGPKYVAPRGLKLSGTYTARSLTQTGLSGSATTSFVGSTSELQFSADGRFTFDHILIMDTSAVVGRDTDGSRSGHYLVRDGTLVLTFANGVQKASSFWYENSNLEAIWLDDSMYEK